MFSDSAYEDFMKRFSADDPYAPARKPLTATDASPIAGAKPNLGTVDVKPMMTTQQASKGLTSYQQGQRDLGGKSNNLMGLASGLMGEASGPGSYANRYDYDPELQSQYLAMEGVKDQIAEVVPYAAAFRAVEKASKEIGTAIGGEEGGDAIGSIVDPLSTQMELLKNEDATTGEKLSSLVPVLGGLSAGNARNRQKNRLAKEKFQKEDLITKKKRDEEYRMEEGLQSMENLKELRKKQLGLI